MNPLGIHWTTINADETLCRIFPLILFEGAGVLIQEASNLWRDPFPGESEGKAIPPVVSRTNVSRKSRKQLAVAGAKLAELAQDWRKGAITVSDVIVFPRESDREDMHRCAAGPALAVYADAREYRGAIGQRNATDREAASRLLGLAIVLIAAGINRFWDTEAVHAPHNQAADWEAVLEELLQLPPCRGLKWPTDERVVKAAAVWAMYRAIEGLCSTAKEFYLTQQEPFDEPSSTAQRWRERLGEMRNRADAHHSSMATLLSRGDSQMRLRITAVHDASHTGGIAHGRQYHDRDVVARAEAIMTTLVNGLLKALGEELPPAEAPAAV
jgi:hypothetical protein